MPSNAVKTYCHFIDGRDYPGAAGSHLEEFDPRTGEVSALVAQGCPADVDAAANAARNAWPGWRSVRPIIRGRVLMDMARMLRARRDVFAALDMRESGRPLNDALAEVESAAEYFEFYGGLVNQPAGEVIDLGEDYHCYTRRVPFGVIGVILPWNSPLNQASRSIAPAIAAGNVVVAKPSEFTSVTLLELARRAHDECGLPAGVLNVVTGEGRSVGTAIAEHPLVSKIVFTGSVAVGRAIGKIAAERVIPVALELGGKSPSLVFSDADIDEAVEGIAAGFTVNAGQVCSAGTRCLVEHTIYDDFLSRLRERVAGLVVGPDGDAAMGPIITESQYDRVRYYTEVASAEGATIFEGGIVRDEERFAKGWFVRPLILTNLGPDTRTAREEIFGPVIVLSPFGDEPDAIRMANDSEYGLVAAIWTRDLQRAHRVAAQLDAGQVFVNQYYAGGVETPFGGFKRSGHGREKGLEALAHYTQVKTTIVRLQGRGSM